MNIHLSGGDIVTADEAEASTRHYTSSPAEQAEETPEVEDETPISDSERKSLDEATESTFQPVFDQQPSDRVDVFVPPGEWENPVLKHRRKQAMRLPSVEQINDLDQRVAAVMRFDGAPKAVATLAQKARTAIGAAREAYDAARHEDNPRYAASQAAKDAVIQQIAKATTAVRALEDATADAGEEWFDNLVSGLEKQREAAAKALTAASKAYAEWRQAIAAADALAREQGRFGDWHNHPDSRELNPLGLIGDLRNARDIATSEDDWISGRYLTADYGDEIPPHTMAYLEAAARRAPGSFAEMTFHRLVGVHKADGPAQDTIAQRDLRIINTSPVPSLMPKHENEA